MIDGSSIGAYGALIAVVIPNPPGLNVRGPQGRDVGRRSVGKVRDCLGFGSEGEREGFYWRQSPSARVDPAADDFYCVSRFARVRRVAALRADKAGVDASKRTAHSPESKT